MADNLFQPIADVYEALVDWPRRLAAEEPFYRRFFERAGVRSLIDVACGTGHHAAMFHGWGLRVEGADLSPSMIDRARAAFGQGDDLRWVVRGFDEPIEPAGTFDAALCVGISLALAPDEATVERAVGQMLAAVRPGGLVILHLLNLWRLPDGPCVWQKCLRMELAGDKVLVVKGVHRSGRRGFVDLVVAPRDGGPLRASESAPLVGLEAEQLVGMLQRAGATDTELFGDYQQQPYERATSVDLIVVARREGAG